MQLSKLEDKAYAELKKNGLQLFKAKDLALLLNSDRIKIYNLIKALKKKGAIIKLNKNFFALNGANEFLIGQTINSPSYLSFWSALSYYGFTDNMPRKIFFATTKYCKKTNNFQYVTLAKEKFFGYAKIGDLTIAEKEKALIDSLMFPKYAGGMKEVESCIKAALKEISVGKLVEYALKINSKSVIRRLGFMLEQLKFRKYDGLLMKNIGKGYELLDPSMKKKNNFNKKWLLDINY